MEPTVSERPLSQEQNFRQLHTLHDGTVNSSDSHFEKNPLEQWYPRRWAGWRASTNSGSFGGDLIRQDEVQTPVCRDNLRGKCTRGAFCKFQHSASDEHDRSRFCQNEREELDAVATLGNSHQYRANYDRVSTTRFSSRGCRSRSPCRRFQNGRCYRGASCPYLHPEMTSYGEPTHDSRVEQLQVDRAVRDPGFGGRNKDNFLRISQECDEANKEDRSRIMSFSGECRSRSPCRNFLRGNCSFGASCKRLHPVNGNVRSGLDMSNQHYQGTRATSNCPGSGEGSRDVTWSTSQEHYAENMHNHLRTGAFSREPRSRSPCRNFLGGKCYRGASCVYLHPISVHDRTRSDSCSAQQLQGVSGTSRSQHYFDGSMPSTFKVSQKQEDSKSNGIRPYRDMYENRAWSMKDGVQLAGNREHLDAKLRSWSHERQQSRSTGDFGSDKRIREVCLRFTKGRCNFGELCRYLHGYHEYATSTSNRSEKPYTAAAGDSGNFGAANRSANTMMAPDHVDVKHHTISSGKSRHTESSSIASDGCFDKETAGRSVDDAIEPIILDSTGDATTMDGLKCEVSGEKIENFCNSDEGHENISLWSRPFKRQRNRSRSPFTPQDDFHCPNFRRYESRIDLRGGRHYNVGYFQYPDRRSYRYQMSMYHVNSQQRSNGEATSAKPCSHEYNDSKMVTPQKYEEVATQGLQLEQHANGDHSSNAAIASGNNEAESARYALQISHMDQNNEELATDSVAIGSSEGAAISQVALESDLAHSGKEHLVSPKAFDLTMLVKEGNVDVNINSGEGSVEKSAELMPLIKTYYRKNKKRHPGSLSCEETIKDYVSDASQQGTPVSSLVDTLLSDPNTVSVSGVPVDKKTTISSNNDLANVLMHDHPVEQREKKRKKKRSRPVSCEETMKEEVTDASKPGTPISSLEETSLTNPDVMSVSDVPVDTKMSASCNYDLGNGLTDDLPVKQKVKKKKCKKKRPKPVVCEETLKEEVADASKPGMPIDSMVETSLSNPDFVSASDIPVDMKVSASSSNDLESGLMDDHPVKKQVKKKRKKKRPKSLSCEGTMKEEVTDGSKLGSPISSLVEASFSNPNIMSVSGVPVDMNMSASNNNDLVNVLMDDHPVKQVKKKRKKKHPACEETMNNEVTDASKQGMRTSSLVEISSRIPNNLSVSGVPVDMETCASKNNNLESVLTTTEDGALLVGNADSHSLQVLRSPLKGVFPNSRRKLLVLDVNGILVDIVTGYNPRYKPDTRISAKAVFKRPFCDEFLHFCFERFDVGIWSSRTQKNLKKVVDFLMRDTKNRLLFCWDQSHCTATGYKTLENKEKPLVLKELRYLWWDNKGERLPWDKGFYNETNTLLLDDSPYKALRNPPYTAIFPYPYSYKNVGDNLLGPHGALRVYLERLAEAENVQKFIQENPFGQKPISNLSRSWDFYAKIVGTYGSQQEESANIKE